MSNDVMDDYLGELLMEAVPPPVAAEPVLAAPAAAKPAFEAPGDSAELEAVFEAALAATQSKATAAPAAPTPPTSVAGDNAALQAAFDDAMAATSAANAGRPPTWDDLPDEVIYETGAAESRKLAHSDSACLQAAFATAAGLPAPPPAPPRSTPNVRALETPVADARPSTWQELQAQAQRPANNQQRRASERSTRWLRLRCGQQTYALELLKVQEVVLPVPLLALRGTGPAMLGIMNLRGQVVPVMDLCRHLDVHSAPEDAQTRIVVLEENGETLGLRVSAVEDVANLNDSQIEPPDTARICQISNELFRGIARVGQQPMILLDAGRLLR